MCTRTLSVGARSLGMMYTYNLVLYKDGILLIGNDVGMLLTCHFRASLKHKDDGQTKFIKLNSQRQDIIIKYWVSIGSIHREQG